MWNKGNIQRYPVLKVPCVLIPQPFKYQPNMKQPFFFPLIFCLLLLCWDPLSGQNNALDFDGDGDYITLAPIVGLPTTQVSAFTVEMWFKSEATGTTPNDCSNGFRRLFSFGDPSNTTLFEVGECNGFLSVFWFTSLGGNLVQMTSSIRDNQWHCLSVVRFGQQL